MTYEVPKNKEVCIQTDLRITVQSFLNRFCSVDFYNRPVCAG